MALDAVSGYVGKMVTDGWVHGSLKNNENKAIIDRPVKEVPAPEMAISKARQKAVSQQVPRQYPASLNPLSRISIRV